MAPFGEAARRLCADQPDLRVVIAASPAVASDIRVRAKSWTVSPLILETEADKLSAMRAATVALACSGTVTTELALAGCPMVVAYKLDFLTHVAAKLLLRTRYITLFNVAAGRCVAPERIQGQCRPDVLAQDLSRLLDDPAARAAQMAAQTSALDIMRGGLADPVGAAADAVLEVLAEKTP
jgi:lipid-A-disaccharide synthase